MRYLITGGSGYIGTHLVEALSLRSDTEEIVIADVRRPRYPRAKTRFEQADVRDRGRMRELVARHRPDALVHLAFILNPLHDEGLMYDIDVNGTAAVLDAASEEDVGHVLVTSSTTAYGAWPDNPRRIDEEWPVRGHLSFAYARHKADSDRLCQLWAARHPERTMTIVRPCIVLGPNVDNYIVRGWSDAPFFPALRGEPDQEVQFVHEDDLAEALTQLLVGRHAGAFNVAGDGTMTWLETAQAAGLKVRRMPYRVAKAIGGAMWSLHASEVPPGNLDFIRHPWVCSNDKVKSTLGWQPRHDTRETFDATLRAHGVAVG